MKINDMNTNLTIWNNLKSSFSLPEQYPFMIKGELDTTLFNTLLNLYRDIEYQPLDNWKGSQQYKGRCFHYNDYVPRAMNSQYSNEYEAIDKRYSYDSTLCFHQPCNVGFDILNTLPFNTVRSKLARLESGIYQGDWHSDEDVREVVKLVIPMKTSDSYKFQIESKPSLTLPLGYALLFDASIPHRVLSDGHDQMYRDYLIFSIPLWWNINHDEVVPSKHFGKNIPECILKEYTLFKND